MILSFNDYEMQKGKLDLKYFSMFGMNPCVKYSVK